MTARLTAAAGVLLAGTLLWPLASFACYLPSGPAAPPTAFEQAASDAALAWVAYDRAETDEAKAAARAALAEVLVGAAGLSALGDLSNIAPSPGILVLVGELFPGSATDEVLLYARVLTALVRTAG